MGRRSRRYRKLFSCGHRGFGQFCHCCADREQQRRQSIQQRQRIQMAKQSMRQLWRCSFADDVIPLEHLPKQIILKARAILSALEQGVGFWQFAGKRLRGERSVVRIPVTHRYRLIGYLQEGRFIPRQVLSHESYNQMTRHGRMRVPGDRRSA